jgi:hypothetical protein
MYGRLYLCDALLEQLAQDLEAMTAELGQCVQKEHAMVGPQHLTRHWHVAPADQPYIRDSVLRGPTRAGRDQRRAVAGEARDAVDPRGLNGCHFLSGRVGIELRIASAPDFLDHVDSSPLHQ